MPRCRRSPRSPIAVASRHARDCWRQHAAALGQSLERDGWDGGWYRRAYFDDGTPLGGAGERRVPDRFDRAVVGRALRRRRTRPRGHRDGGGERTPGASRRTDWSLLFTPPFDRTARDPGYIKGYPPGIRENGGQYTHAALWSVIAFAMLGDGDKAGELFSLLNPITHSSTRADIYRYKVEPYVVCADVYAEPSHVGRGGWTWYTGSAGWMYRAGLEWMLGFRLRGTTLVIDPCVPKSWPGFDDRVPVSLRTLRHRGREPERRQPRHLAHRGRRPSRCKHQAHRSPCPTMRRPITYR